MCYFPNLVCCEDKNRCDNSVIIVDVRVISCKYAHTRN